MKSRHDPRHQKRRDALRELFALSFTPQTQSEFVKDILSESKDLDAIIAPAAPAWPIDKLNRVDLAVLRLATYELIHKSAPSKVIIDEAVELAKEFGSDSSSSFVNGVLGNIMKSIEQ